MKVLPLLVSLLCALLCLCAACGSGSSRTNRSVAIVSTYPDYVLAYEPISENKFMLEVRNTSLEPIFMCSYFFGYTVEITYKNGKSFKYDFSEDKAPVPTMNDWHILRPKQTFGWSVELPSGFPSLAEAQTVKYFDSGLKIDVPKHIYMDAKDSRRRIIKAKWSIR